ncbi:60S ribosomal protein L21e, putative [Theileria equi strain WA]|uniref:60S ribosomal protein L21e, putative n=1 Tax=Theileria equi strain WA TaxID=1537102 RepID=L0AUR8_THEEQ|nr:60S ribosomal protein L21e, putative [Theileria equi strain WA]AFZ78973.1 60S ribosomal protein L21e, putative [Theileria equi strain WA]|eukprot:XP_004828639.1 60S ribosomal protein L21e, putative [Theileria equi strain WA]
MPHSYGKRARTRDKFAKPFRRHGMPSVGRYLQNYKVGDYVDIICDSSVHKGMPYSFYHGRTGVVYNVAPRALGIMVKKVVRGKELLKRINVHIEHVRKSRCREEFLKRVATNDALRREAKLEGKKLKLKREPKPVAPGYLVTLEPESIITMDPVPFVEKY